MEPPATDAGPPATSPGRRPGPGEAYAFYERALGDRDPPLALLDLDAMAANAHDMVRRAAGKPIRVASKSIRCRAVVDRVLRIDPAYRGQLCFTLPEALWLSELGYRDLVVAYPTADRSALGRLARATAELGDGAPAVMVDSTGHLDLIEGSGADPAHPVRVAIDFDAGLWLAGGRLKFGPKRSPLHTPSDCRALAEQIARRPGVRLVGAMGYEGQVAGVGDDRSGGPRTRVENAVTRLMQAASMRELAGRRAEIVAAIRAVQPDLEFVNGGGTGSLERTAAEDAVTELAAGSGLYAPVLFDGYRSFTLRPAAMFCLPVVRRPDDRTATALGGGYLASGVGGADRMPVPHLPAGLGLDSMEGTGEVQTPLHGEAAARLRVGDRVYFRHVKAGELCERFDSLLLIEDGRVVDEVPTYRGEGRCFL